MKNGHKALILIMSGSAILYFGQNMIGKTFQYTTTQEKETELLELSSKEHDRIKQKQETMKRLRTDHHLNMDHAK